MAKAKTCPICGGNPQFVYYSIPGTTNDPDGIYILLKRLECSKCKATVAQLMLSCDDAIDYWNAINPDTGKRYVLEINGTEMCRDVEGGEGNG